MEEVHSFVVEAEDHKEVSAADSEADFHRAHISEHLVVAVGHRIAATRMKRNGMMTLLTRGATISATLKVNAEQNANREPPHVKRKRVAHVAIAAVRMARDTSGRAVHHHIDQRYHSQ